MSKLIKGKLQDKKVELKIFEGLHKGVMAKVNAIVVHQTGAPTAQHTFNSYKSASHGAHFLIDKTGKIYQTALTTQITHHVGRDRKSTRLNSSHVAISYAVFCLKKKK